MSPSRINLLSGCTVHSMAVSSYIRNLKSPVKLNCKTTAWLALGACVGGSKFASNMDSECTDTFFQILLNVYNVVVSF